jgi:diadenosine tetraphosphate (Ap4A) HIT family hydrolase
MNVPISRPCALCVAVRDATAPGGCAFPYNRNLLETERFVVLPSVGPLFTGHIMVVSKMHFTSLASMGKPATQEYDHLAQRLRRAPFLAEALEAEHGSTATDKAGACVIHTHIHWIPTVGRFFDDFGKRLKVMDGKRLETLESEHLPYIFVRSDSRQAVYDSQGLPSQTIRRILCEIMERDDTDWMQAPRFDLIEQTIKSWESAR